MRMRIAGALAVAMAIIGCREPVGGIAGRSA